MFPFKILVVGIGLRERKIIGEKKGKRKQKAYLLM